MVEPSGGGAGPVVGRVRWWGGSGGGAGPVVGPGPVGHRDGVRVTLSATGPVPAAEAWRRYARLELWPTWSPQLRRTEPGGVLTPGLTGRVYGPLGVHADFTVDRVDVPARCWAWTVRRGPLTVRLTHGVRSTTAGSRTWLLLDGPAPVVLGYAPLARYALHRLVTLP